MVHSDEWPSSLCIRQRRQWHELDGHVQGLALHAAVISLQPENRHGRRGRYGQLIRVPEHPGQIYHHQTGNHGHGRTLLRKWGYSSSGSSLVTCWGEQAVSRLVPDGRISKEIAVQKVGHNTRLVVAVGCDLRDGCVGAGSRCL